MSEQIAAVKTTLTYTASAATTALGISLTLSEIATITGIVAALVGIVISIFTAVYNVKHKRMIREIMEKDRK